MSATNQLIGDRLREAAELLAATAGRLPRIAPRRFNPSGDAWLPMLHTERGPWQLTALFSNTARAHELGNTRGVLTGRRVVRGREEESRTHYDAPKRSADPNMRPVAPAASER